MAVTLQTGLKQKQKLVLNQSMIQSMKMLQMNTLELAAAINEALLSNPVLEEAQAASEVYNSRVEKEIDNRVNGDNSEYENSYQERMTFADSSDTGYSYILDDDNRKRMFIENTVTDSESLQSSLLSQLKYVECDEKEKEVMQYLITSLDEGGLFRGKISDVSAECGVSQEKVDYCRNIIMKLDPVGCSSISIQESLYCQAVEKYPTDEILPQIIDNYFKELTDLNYSYIASKLNVSEEDILSSTAKLQSLAPYPSASHAGEKVQYVYPDIEVNYIDGEIIISFNDEWLPQLTISDYYTNMLKDGSSEKKIREYLQENINEAKNLIWSINGRKETIFKIVNSIMHRQVEFLKRGPGNLKPLVYSDVSQDIEMHESTVSRTVNSKYIQTEWGVYPLKYFFVQKAQKVGDDYSSDNAAKLITNIIQNEDPEKPFSDEEIVKKLRSSDINIARRTVAKYREKMAIPSSSRRKRLNKINTNTEG